MEELFMQLINMLVNKKVCTKKDLEVFVEVTSLHLC